MEVNNNEQETKDIDDIFPDFGFRTEVQKDSGLFEMSFCDI